MYLFYFISNGKLEFRRYHYVELRLLRISDQCKALCALNTPPTRTTRISINEPGAVGDGSAFTGSDRILSVRSWPSAASLGPTSTKTGPPLTTITDNITHHM
jgi:hypothetical protein